MGNMGEHEIAIRIDIESVKESLKCRRLVHMDYKIYDILWNDQEILKNEGKQVDLKKMADDLSCCISISHYTKRYFYEKIYKDKIIKIQF